VRNNGTKSGANALSAVPHDVEPSAFGADPRAPAAAVAQTPTARTRYVDVAVSVDTGMSDLHSDEQRDERWRVAALLARSDARPERADKRFLNFHLAGSWMRERIHVRYPAATSHPPHGRTQCAGAERLETRKALDRRPWVIAQCQQDSWSENVQLFSQEQRRAVFPHLSVRLAVWDPRHALDGLQTGGAQQRLDELLRLAEARGPSMQRVDQRCGAPHRRKPEPRAPHRTLAMSEALDVLVPGVGVLDQQVGVVATGDVWVYAEHENAAPGIVRSDPRKRHAAVLVIFAIALAGPAAGVGLGGAPACLLVSANVTKRSRLAAREQTSFLVDVEES